MPAIEIAGDEVGHRGGVAQRGWSRREPGQRAVLVEGVEPTLASLATLAERDRPLAVFHACPRESVVPRRWLMLSARRGFGVRRCDRVSAGGPSASSVVSTSHLDLGTSEAAS